MNEEEFEKLSKRVEELEKKIENKINWKGVFWGIVGTLALLNFFPECYNIEL